MRRVKSPLLLLFATVAALASHRVDDGTAGESAAKFDAVAEPEFTIGYFGGTLVVNGHIASSKHEDELAAIIDAHVAAQHRQVELKPHVLPPENWQALTTSLAETLLRTESASVSVSVKASDRGIELNAVTSDRDQWLADLARLESGSLGAFKADVIAVPPAVPAGLCGRMLDVLSKDPIEFEPSSATLRTSAYPVLDRIVEYALDCDSSRISITGHTDARGDEAWNARLSLERASAVADYLSARGLTRDRLVVAGKGESQPIASNDTPWGRTQNRRIEFGLDQSAE